MSNFEATMEQAAKKDLELGKKLMNDKRQLEEKIKFFDNAIKAVNSATFSGYHAKHIGALIVLLENEQDGAKAEYEAKYPASIR